MRTRGRLLRLDADCCGPPAAREGSVANRIARSFDRQMRESAIGTNAVPASVPISARLLELLGDVETTRLSLLDLGCGTGATAIRLAQRGACPVIGIDLSPASVEVARSRLAGTGLDQTQARFNAPNAHHHR